MKIEVGKFYKHKENGHKLLAIIKFNNTPIEAWRFWDYSITMADNWCHDEVEEWKEPMTKEVWAYLNKSGHYTYLESPLPEEDIKRWGYIGARKVTLVEGEWE